ncbi:MAG: hypothetical protein ABEI78_01850 [Candidatus Nanohaloarchaea archaeon]
MPKSTIDLTEEADDKIKKLKFLLDMDEDIELNKAEAIVKALENIDVEKTKKRISGDVHE